MKKLVFIFIFCLCGCANKQTQILPSNDTIIKLKVEKSVGIIAESKEYSYQFTSPEAILELKSYHDFLAENKDDIESVSITFYQENLSDEIVAQYSNFIPEVKALNNKKLLAKYKSKSILRDGYYQVLFKTKGNFYKQSNTLSDQYLLPESITVFVKSNHKKESDIVIQGDMIGLIIFPIFIPMAMVGCLIGPC
ncbi:MAG: hypothetical protein J6567_10365 [Gilliamella sp.]|uniref:hypothetical protein n=1 Tax=Gilliamella sp. TaxID=1891236 RepID=UPI0025EF28F9|nr:hypothetical protein [Gilliamella sp.]MCO6538347.1 hypothetical protein [Gilliamella sp.]